MKKSNKSEKGILYESCFLLFFSWIERLINHFLSKELELKRITIKESEEIL